MVTDALRKLTSSESDWAIEVAKTIQWLTITSLKSVNTEDKLLAICTLVIDAVDRLLLVPVDEDELKNRKVKKHKYIPIEYSHDEVWNQSAQIRSDWSSDKWQKKPPKGWIYLENDSVLWVIYQPHGKKSQNTIFINREVADNPIGAMLLIKIMKERIQKISK